MSYHNHKKPLRKHRHLRAVGDDETAVDTSSIPVSPESPDPGPVQIVSDESGQTSPVVDGGSGPAGPLSPFTTISGVCYATSSDVLSTFKNLQRQMNRVADKMGTAKIGVDGQIGPQTIALLSAIKSSPLTSGGTAAAWQNFIANQDTSSCSAIAAQAITLAQMIGAMADSLGVPSSVTSPAPASTPVIANGSGQLVPQGPAASLGDTWNNLSSATKLVAGAVAVGAIVLATKKSKKGGASKGRRYWGI